MQEGCGMVREGGLKGGEKVEVKTKAQKIKVVPSRREKQREVERKAQNALPKKKERKFNSYGKKCGRKAGSKNVYVGVREFQKIPEVHQETLYWKAHKMVSQPRDMTAVVDGKVVKVGRKANQKCFFFKHSGTGLCPQVVATGMAYKSDGRCSKYCNACDKPFHEICTWVYHEAILKGFDGQRWIREVWVRETLQSLSENNNTEESDDESSQSDT